MTTTRVPRTILLLLGAHPVAGAGCGDYPCQSLFKETRVRGFAEVADEDGTMQTIELDDPALLGAIDNRRYGDEGPIVLPFRVDRGEREEDFALELSRTLFRDGEVNGARLCSCIDSFPWTDDEGVERCGVGGGDGSVSDCVDLAGTADWTEPPAVCTDDGECASRYDLSIDVRAPDGPAVVVTASRRIETVDMTCEHRSSGAWMLQ